MKKETVEQKLNEIVDEVRNSLGYTKTRYENNPFHIDRLKYYLDSEKLGKKRDKLENIRSSIRDIVNLIRFSEKNEIKVESGTGKFKITKYDEELAIGLLSENTLSYLQDFTTHITIETQEEISKKEYWNLTLLEWEKMTVLEKAEFIETELTEQIAIAQGRIKHLNSPYK